MENKEAESDEATIAEYTYLEIRVGRIVECWVHPEYIYRENYYCEKIDFGDKKVANFMSHGMVLCASGPNKSKIEIMRPPADAKLGERVKLEGQESLFKDAK